VMVAKVGEWRAALTIELVQGLCAPVEALLSLHGDSATEGTSPAVETLRGFVQCVFWQGWYRYLT
jgi:hypothetical protein